MYAYITYAVTLPFPKIIVALPIATTYAQATMKAPLHRCDAGQLAMLPHTKMRPPISSREPF